MVEQTPGSESPSLKSALAVVAVLAALLLLSIGGTWALNGVEKSPLGGDLLEIVRTSAGVMLLATAAWGGVLWIRGRRRVEDEANAAGRSILAAQEAFDAQPRPIVWGLIHGSVILSALAGMAPKLITLLQTGAPAKMMAAGSVLLIGVGFVALCVSRVLRGAVGALRD